MYVEFNTPHQYLFYHENVKHLFLLWKKEHKREIYIVEDEGETVLLRYPGETYVDKLLHDIEPIFFQQLVNEEGSFPVILGATFYYKEQLVGMYYTPPHPQEPLYFFYIKDEEIQDIYEEEYKIVVQTFTKKFKEIIVE